MSDTAHPDAAARRVLVTGAGGFIGSRVARALEARGDQVLRMLHAGEDAPGVVCADLADAAALVRACAGIDLIVHCAGHAHAFDVGVADEQRLQHEVNFVGTRNLGEAAATAGVRHLVFLSSVKAMGAPGDACADEDWPLPPETPYGRAKRAAEEALDAIAAASTLSVTHLRLAMVYGHGSRGNLERMLRGIRAGWFPPLPDTGARRSLVHVADVVRAVLVVLDEPRAFGRVWIVADGATYSTALIGGVARELCGRRHSLWHVPAAALRGAGRVGDFVSILVRRRLPMSTEAVRRLLDDESYSAAAIRRDVGWESSVNLADGLRESLFGTPVPDGIPPGKRA